MADLIIPNKIQHKYVVGIDFGHGETSAAICPIEWDKDAGLRETKILDIDLDIAARKKVITSSICRVSGGILIGDEAFEHTTDNIGIRVCFKQKPLSIEGDAEKLMIDYMRTVYARVRESQEELTDMNHIVYIARPSGWTEKETKELYRQMAVEAGIPLGGLTSESRAAIFYAKSPNVNFSKEISKGAIVFDLGSSTLDFTYLSDNDKPVDFGYDLGASIIDNAIFENMMLKDENIRLFIEKYPAYKDALKFKARKFKEDAYSRNEDSKTIGGFPLGNIIADDEESYDEYADVYVKLRITNLAELNTMIELTTCYMKRLKNALIDFKENKIPEKSVNGVFLTGGASRMNFIRPLIAETFNLPLDKVKIDNDNPSLTISRGIALLGATDAITSVLISELRKKIPSLLNNEQMLSKLIGSLAEDITTQSWKVVDSTCSYWVKFGETTDEKELKTLIENKLKNFQKNNVPQIINDTLHSFISEYSEEIRKQMNKIISRYAPGREISSTGTIQIGNVDAINNSLSDMSKTISQICDSISNMLANIFWVALGIYLWGIFCAPYYLYKLFRSDESKRKDKVSKIIDKKTEVTSQVEQKIKTELRNNTDFKNTVATSVNKYFTKLIESNLQKVIIPIE